MRTPRCHFLLVPDAGVWKAICDSGSPHRKAGPSLPPQSLERSVVNVQVASRDGAIERQVALLGVEEANAITKCCVPGPLNEYEWTIARYEWILLIAKRTTGNVSQ